MATEEAGNPWAAPIGPAELAGVREFDPRNSASELRFSDEARHRRYLERQRGEPVLGRAIFVAFCGLLIIAIAAAAAYVVASQLEKTYAARAQIQLQISADESAETASRVLVSQALAVRSRTALEATAKAHNVPIDDLEDRVKSRVLPDSSIIEVDVEDRDRATALAMLNQILTGYLAPKEPAADSAANAFVTAQIASLDQRLTEIDQRLATLGTSSSNSREAQQLATERATVVARRDALLQTSVDLSIQRLSASDVSVLAAPYVLEDAVSPQPMRAAVLAAAVGAIIAATLAYLLLRRPALT